MNLYDSLSRFYDLENADFVEDLDFWVGLAKDSGGPVLELGCGSGRATQQIARAGVAIVGLDNSEPMLALARAKLNRKPELAARATLVHGDMTNFDLSSLFTVHCSLIICPFNTFMHLTTTAEQLALLSCARRHLNPGGLLVLDLTNPAPAYVDTNESLTLERTFRDDENDLAIQQFATTRVDRTAQIAHILWQYDAIAADGAVQRTLVPLALRYTFPAEMSLLLERANFKLAHLYGGYDEAPLTDESERMIVVAEAI
jgi:SAM-dependent methyltransferase